ncbi:MAG: alpha/beta hydrolase [Candidatus Hodarchaeales archaeon]|jgi:pimeloyl-ACP methyl ester carboxylesterase
MLESLIPILVIIFFSFICYLVLSFVIIFILAKLPRDPVPDIPDWGILENHRIPTVHNKKLECWVVYPSMRSSHYPSSTDSPKSIILLHGWGRNRGRMVSRAKIYGKKGFITILFSARDHGESDKEITGMSIVRFSQDLEACINWWGKPVLICGHSIGGGASILIGARNPLVKGIIAESSPHRFPFSLKYVYRPALRGLTPLLIPGITLITLFVFRRFLRKDYSPIDNASRITKPTFIIHGKQDSIFPFKYSIELKNKIKNSQIWTPEEGNHFNLETLPEYKTRIEKFLTDYSLI